MNNENKNSGHDISGLSQSFQAMIDNPEIVFQSYDMLPMPIQVFAPDGLLLFSNRSFLEFNNIPDASLIVGKYNLLTDPVCNDQLGMREIIQKAFRGEAVSTSFPPPIQDFVDRHVIDEKPFESAYVETCLLPVMNDGQLVYVINTFIVKQMYQGRPEIARAKEYIDAHWQDEYDPDTIAAAVNISSSRLFTLFKQSNGLTMHDYYKKVKVDHIKEKLMDKSLSIAEAFSFCGEDNRGALGRAFKELTGMTPTEYRNSLK